MSDAGRPRGGGGAADDVLGALSQRVRELQTKVATLQSELDEAQRKLATYEEFDSTLQDALSTALRAAYEIRSRAEDTAGQILEQARDERRMLLKEVQRLRDERDSLQDEIATLRRGGLTPVPRSVPAPEAPSSADLKTAAAEAMRSVFEELLAEMRGRLAQEAPAPRVEPAARAEPAAPPRVEPPRVEAPKTERAPLRVEFPPKVERPAARVEPAAPPRVETPKVEPPRIETPRVEAPYVEPPKVEAPKPAPPPRPEPQLAPRARVAHVPPPVAPQPEAPATRPGPAVTPPPAAKAEPIVDESIAAPKPFVEQPPFKEQPPLRASVAPPAVPPPAVTPLPANVVEPQRAAPAAPAPRPAVEPSGPTTEVQLVLSPIPSFPRLVEIERRIQSLPGVRTLYVRDFRNGVATLAVGLRSAMTADEFASSVRSLERPRFVLESVMRNTVELRIESEAQSA